MRYLLLLLLLSACCAPDIYVEIADSPDGWQQGLMYRAALAQDHGMLFVFPGSDMRSFWMKNTEIPLDMIFLDENMVVINVEPASPCVSDPCPLYNSAAPARYVLELNQGASERFGIRKGKILAECCSGLCVE